MGEGRESRRVAERWKKGKEERDRSLCAPCIISSTKEAMMDDGREMLDEGKIKFHSLLLHFPSFKQKKRKGSPPSLFSNLSHFNKIVNHGPDGVYLMHLFCA